MTNPSDNDKIKKLLEQAEQMRAKAGQGQADASAAKTSGNVISDAKAVRATARAIGSTARFLSVAGAFLYKVFRPLIERVILPLGRLYVRAWNKFCYKTDKTTGERNFKRGRAMTMLLTTVAAATAIVPGPVGQPARAIMGGALETVGDGMNMTMTGTYKSNETLYLTGSQELGGASNEHSVKGCRQQDCSDGGVYFTVRNSLAHNIWSVLTRGSWFYVTDMETSTIAPGRDNECQVTSYGFRTRFFQYMDVYPTILSAKCHPITGNYNDSAARNAAPTATATPAARVAASAPAPAG